MTTRDGSWHRLRVCALVGAMTVGLAACGGGDDGSALTPATSAPDESQVHDTGVDRDARDEGDGNDEVIAAKDAITAYVEALGARDYQTALQFSSGPAAGYAGYFNVASELELPPDFAGATDPRETAIELEIDAVEPDGDGFATVDGSVTATMTDTDTIEVVFTDLVLSETDSGGFEVHDYTVSVDGTSLGPVAEDIRLSSGTASAAGIKVSVGPAYGQVGDGAVGTVFTNFVFVYDNAGDAPVAMPYVEWAGLDNPASLMTAEDLFHARASAGDVAAPGERGYGWLHFNDELPDTGEGILTLRFERPDTGETIEVEVPVEW